MFVNCIFNMINNNNGHKKNKNTLMIIEIKFISSFYV